MNDNAKKIAERWVGAASPAEDGYILATAYLELEEENKRLLCGELDVLRERIKQLESDVTCHDAAHQMRYAEPLKKALIRIKELEEEQERVDADYFALDSAWAEQCEQLAARIKELEAARDERERLESIASAAYDKE